MRWKDRPSLVEGILTSLVVSNAFRAHSVSGGGGKFGGTTDLTPTKRHRRGKFTHPLFRTNLAIRADHQDQRRKALFLSSLTKANLAMP